MKIVRPENIITPKPKIKEKPKIELNPDANKLLNDFIQETLPEETINFFIVEMKLSKEEYKRFIKKGGIDWIKKELEIKKRGRKRNKCQSTQKKEQKKDIILN